MKCPDNNAEDKEKADDIGERSCKEEGDDIIPYMGGRVAGKKTNKILQVNITKQDRAR
jgi:hypothetical protein